MSFLVVVHVELCLSGPARSSTQVHICNSVNNNNDVLLWVNELLDAILILLITTMSSTTMMELFDAIYNKDLAKVESFIVDCVDIDSILIYCCPILHIAVMYGSLEIVHALIQAGADLDARALADGLSPLHLAAYDNKLAYVNALIAAGADVDIVTDDGMTPLCLATSMATSCNNIAIVNALIQAHANINHQSAGRTALYFAITYDNMPAVNILIDASIDVSTHDINISIEKNNKCATIVLLDAYAKNPGFDHRFFNDITIKDQLEILDLRPDLRLQYLHSYFNAENRGELLRSVITACCSYNVYADERILHLAIKMLQETHSLFGVVHISAVTSQNLITLSDDIVDRIFSYLTAEEIRCVIQASSHENTLHISEEAERNNAAQAQS